MLYGRQSICVLGGEEEQVGFSVQQRWETLWLSCCLLCTINGFRKISVWSGLVTKMEQQRNLLDGCLQPLVHTDKTGW